MGLILKMNLLLPSCWDFSFALEIGVSPQSCSRAMQPLLQDLPSCWEFSALGLIRTPLKLFTVFSQYRQNMSDVLSANSRHLLLLDCQHCPLNPGSSLGPLPFTEAWRPSQGPNMRQFHGSLCSLATHSQGSLCIFSWCPMLWKPLFHTFGTFFWFQARRYI